MVWQIEHSNRRKYIPDMETLFSFGDGLLEISRGRSVKISGNVDRRVIRDALRRYYRFFGEKIACEVGYSDDIDADACGIYSDVARVILINRDEDPDEESSALLHELGHLRYRIDSGHFLTLRFTVPFSGLLVESSPLFKKSIDEVAACYLELATGIFEFDPECFDTSNGAYEAANALLESKVDRRIVWDSLVRTRSLDGLVQRLNGNLHPSAQRLLLDISRKQQ